MMRDSLVSPACLPLRRWIIPQVFENKKRGVGDYFSRNIPAEECLCFSYCGAGDLVEHFSHPRRLCAEWK
jgi:hypothetical protein